jgi:hypothetical protein
VSSYFRDVSWDDGSTEFGSADAGQFSGRTAGTDLSEAIQAIGLGRTAGRLRPRLARACCPRSAFRLSQLIQHGVSHSNNITISNTSTPSLLRHRSLKRPVVRGGTRRDGKICGLAEDALGAERRAGHGGERGGSVLTKTQIARELMVGERDILEEREGG